MSSTHAVDGPSPQTEEREDDQRYVGDFLTLVEILRIDLDKYRRKFGQQGAVTGLVAVAKLLEGGAALSTDQFLLGFHDRWGIPCVLRALARAMDEEHLR